MPAGTFIALCIGLGAGVWHLALGGQWAGAVAWPALFAGWHWSQVAGRARFGRLDLKRPRLWATTLALWLPLPLLWHCALGGARPHALHGVAALMLVGCALRSWTLLRAVHASGIGPAMAAARIAAVPLLVGACVSLAHSPKGDEPHYLRITQSLAEDGNLDLREQLEREPGGLPAADDPRVHGARRVAADGSIRWISQHLPGLPAVLLPGWLIAGRVGAVATMALLGWLCVLLATAWCRQSGADPVAAMVGGLLAGLGVPVASYATVVFPELPAAVAALAVAWAMGGERKRPVVAAFALAFVPWLNFRYVAIGLPLGVWALWRARKSPAQIVPLLTVPAVWIGALFYYVHWVTGSYDPASLYPGMGGFTDAIARGEFARILLALWFDHRVGLAVLAPIWFLAIPWGRTAPVPAVVPLVCTAVLVSVGMADWDGSFSPPARLVVAAIPVSAPLLAMAWRRATASPATGRVAAAMLVLFAAAQTIAALSNPTLAWTDSGGAATLLARPFIGLLPDLDRGALLADYLPRVLALVVVWGLLRRLTRAANSGENKPPIASASS